MNSNLNKLCDKIAHVFISAESISCSDISVYASDEQEECFLSGLKNKSWPEIDCNFWLEYRSEIALLGLESLSHFLPSLLIASLREISSSSENHSIEVTQSIINVLTDPVEDDSGFGLAAFWRKKFNADQLNALMSYLDILSGNPDFDYDFENIINFRKFLEGSQKIKRSNIHDNPIMKTVTIGYCPAFSAWLKRKSTFVPEDVMDIIKEISIDVPLNVDLEESDIEEIFPDILLDDWRIK